MLSHRSACVFLSISSGSHTYALYRDVFVGFEWAGLRQQSLSALYNGSYGANPVPNDTNPQPSAREVKMTLKITAHYRHPLQTAGMKKTTMHFSLLLYVSIEKPK